MHLSFITISQQVGVWNIINLLGKTVTLEILLSSTSIHNINESYLSSNSFIKYLVTRNISKTSSLILQYVVHTLTSPSSIVVQIMATGVYRSDWHGWKGHDSDINIMVYPLSQVMNSVVSCIKSGSLFPKSSWEIGSPFVWILRRMRSIQTYRMSPTGSVGIYHFGKFCRICENIEGRSECEGLAR